MSVKSLRALEQFTHDRRIATPHTSCCVLLSMAKHATSRSYYRSHRMPVVIDTDRGCNCFMGGGDELKRLLNQIRCQTVDAENELLSFGRLVPQCGVDTLLRVSIEPTLGNITGYLKLRSLRDDVEVRQLFRRDLRRIGC